LTDHIPTPGTTPGGAHAPAAIPEREPGTGFWRGRRVLVTGGGGFLGSHLVEQLRALGAEPFVPRRAEYDLTRQADVERVYAESAPQLVMHLAAEVGGIGANRASPGRFFYANAVMGVMMIEEARRAGVEKFVQVGTVCAYPKYTRVPFREEELWTGYPEETNAPYGIAKKSLLVQLQAYRQQYGMNGIYLLPTNLYGPRDNFDPATSHVIPALIRRMVEARRDGLAELPVWGTGNASREFLYVDDAARALVLAAEHFNGAEPVNVGIGNEIRIVELAGLIAQLVGYEGRLAFDPSQPDGQPRRSLDTRRARELFGFTARVGIRDGLRRTVDWYLSTVDR
jgi:GDP-L-fucose synthase